MNNTTLSGEMPKRNVIARFVEMKRNKIVEVISALFILLFLYTAISKSFSIQSTIIAIEKTPFFSDFANEISWSIVFIEYVASALLFFPGTRKLGLFTSLSLMIAFSSYLTYMKLFVPNLPCSCGGIISLLTWNQHIVFNIFFSFLALLGILLSNPKKA